MLTIDPYRSQLSLDCAAEARAAVLSFFKAPPEYTVIFTANATAALKLVGESFPFVGGSSYVLGMDSHNSVSRFSLSLLCGQKPHMVGHQTRLMAYANTPIAEAPELSICKHCHLGDWIRVWRRYVITSSGTPLLKDCFSEYFVTPPTT